MSDKVMTTSDSWNVARGYSEHHFLVPLIECQQYVKIAYYGVSNIDSEHEVPRDIKSRRRVSALRRLLTTLIQIVDNAHFVFAEESDPMKKLLNVEKRLNIVKKYIDAVERETNNQVAKTSSISIYEPHFSLVLETLRLCLRDVKKPLNMQNLIFPPSHDVDMDALKEEIALGG